MQTTTGWCVNLIVWTITHQAEFIIFLWKSVCFFSIPISVIRLKQLFDFDFEVQNLNSWYAQKSSPNFFSFSAIMKLFKLSHLLQIHTDFKKLKMFSYDLFIEASNRLKTVKGNLRYES